MNNGMMIRKTAQSFSTLLSISRKTRRRSRWRKEHANFYFYLSLHKKWSFPLRISSENVTVNVTMFQWFYPNFAAILQNYVLSISFSCDFYFHGIFFSDFKTIPYDSKNTTVISRNTLISSRYTGLE